MTIEDFTPTGFRQMQGTLSQKLTRLFNELRGGTVQALTVGGSAASAAAIGVDLAEDGARYGAFIAPGKGKILGLQVIVTTAYVKGDSGVDIQLKKGATKIGQFKPTGAGVAKGKIITEALDVDFEAGDTFDLITTGAAGGEAAGRGVVQILFRMG